MAQNINSKRLEQQAYMRYHQDGLLELFIGLGILFFGLMMLFDQDFPLAAAWVVLWVPMWTAAKRSVTARRISHDQISRGQDAGLWRAGVLVTAVLLLSVVAAMLILWGRVTGIIPAWFETGLREYLMLILGLGGSLVIGVAAWTSGLSRLYAYALLTAVAFVGGYLLNAPIALAVAVVGGIITLWGLGMLVRFVREHPVQQA
jgi:hypothetical protein